MAERIIYDDHWCKITIRNADMAGCYYVVLDEDDETAQAAVGMEEALNIAEDLRESFIEEHGQFGVGA